MTNQFLARSSKVSESVEVKYKENSDISVNGSGELGVDFVFWTKVQRDGPGFKFRYSYDSDAQKDRFLKLIILRKIASKAYSES